MQQRSIFSYCLLVLFLFTAFNATAQKGKKKDKKKKYNTVKPMVLGVVSTTEIAEASGLAASTALPGCYWTHNDSGGNAEVYLLDSTAQLLSVVHLKGTLNRDWEDIAEGIGPVAGKKYVYVGDIGNNLNLGIPMQIYRFTAPTVVPGHHVSVNPDVLYLSYPDGPKDAESLMVDPLSRNIYIVSKREKQVHLYRVPRFNFKNGDKVTLEKLITLPYTWITAADISQDGRHIIIRTKTNIYYWRRKGNESVETTMSQPAVSLPYAPEKQGEGVTFKAGNTGYITISEGKKPSLFYYPHSFK